MIDSFSSSFYGKEWMNAATIYSFCSFCQVVCSILVKVGCNVYSSIVLKFDTLNPYILKLLLFLSWLSYNRAQLLVKHCHFRLLRKFICILRFSCNVFNLTSHYNLFHNNVIESCTTAIKPDFETYWIMNRLWFHVGFTHLIYLMYCPIVFEI